ncbi:hypothetical protein KVT40_000040 [Elsinoe batatas]|uniref:Uncharacterized protein n=1 Tax=Elsinoe batatas TaxID=2601811 RepID=A0A8K0PG25_9PEZI|nr:hypothetical protein KVT40_000040 [Elsinoe batatas]
MRTVLTFLGKRTYRSVQSLKTTMPNMASYHAARLSFYHQPPEVRNKIYAEALVSSWPILVWSGHPPEAFGEKWKPDLETPKRSLEGINTSLMKADARTSREATAVFYGHNTFTFGAAHEWRPVISWLRDIGDNRHRITKLELEVRGVSRAFQHADGLREGFADEFTDRVFPRHPLLQQPHGRKDWETGEVDVVDPEIEKIFSLLAISPDHASTDTIVPVTIYMDNVSGCYPGAYDDPTNEYLMMESLHLSMDLPNLIEAWRAKYTHHQRPIDVLWRSWGQKWQFEMMEAQFIDAGWDIIHHAYTGDQESDPQGEVGWEEIAKRPVEWTMRRKPLEGPIFASSPNPGGWGTPTTKLTITTPDGKPIKL